MRESCNQNINGRGNISSIMPLGTISKSYMSDFLIENNIDIGVMPENDVKVFSVVYETIDWDGIVRQASGAIYVPDVEENLSFQFTQVNMEQNLKEPMLHPSFL